MQVLIIDSSILIIERLQELLAEVEDVSMIFGTASYKDGLIFFTTQQPNAVIVNSIGTNNEVLELLNAIKKSAINTKIIMLLNNEEKFMQEIYKAAGVHFFLDKYNEFLQIPNIISSIKTNSNNVKYQST
jgi:DNA-binding NarL/FixJ family response regulator